MFLSHLNEVQYLSHATVKRASKRPICFATLLQNGLKNYVTRFTAHVQTFLGTNPVVVSWMDTNFWLDKTMRESRQTGECSTTYFLSRQVWFLGSLRSRRLEVLSTRKNRRARRSHARGEGAPSPLGCLLPARPFSLSPTILPSPCYAG